MALRNRCRPDGRIVANRARGLFTGNRGGRIHDPETRALRPGRPWASKAWICCVTEFRGRHRTVMGAGYTHLFFLDEVTALAAGHRPCFECRYVDAKRFQAAFCRSHQTDDVLRAAAMDVILHRERLAAAGTGFDAPLASLPDGTAIEATLAGDGPFWMVRGSSLLLWSFNGYKLQRPRPNKGLARVVTPRSIVGVFQNGYAPVWHESAGETGQR